MPPFVFRSVAFRLAASGAFALALTVSAGAQQEPAAGQRSGSSATPAPGQGRSSTPARASAPRGSAAGASQEGAQPRGASDSRAQERGGSKPGAATAAKPEAAKPEAAKPDAAKAEAKPAAKPAATPTGAKSSSGKAAVATAGAGPGGGQATLLATFDDWGAYATQGGKSRVCYALSQPTERTPKTASRESAYLFVSFRPSENVRNEVALVMGFPTKDGGEAQATIGNATYGLVTKGQNAWIKNPAEEGQVITTMSRSSSVTVKATSGRGSPTSDRYSLKGFGKALEKARDECK